MAVLKDSILLLMKNKDIGNLNRDIQKTNNLLLIIKHSVKEPLKFIAQLREKVTSALVYLEELGINTLDDLENHINFPSSRAKEINANSKQKRKRIKEIDNIIHSIYVC